MMLLRVSFIGSSKFISLIWSSLDIKERNLPFLMSNLYLYGNLDLLLPIPPGTILVTAPKTWVNLLL